LLSAATVAADTVAHRQLLRLKRVSHGIATRNHQMGNQAGFTVRLVLLPQKSTDAIGQGHNFRIQLILRVSLWSHDLAGCLGFWTHRKLRALLPKPLDWQAGLMAEFPPQPLPGLTGIYWRPLPKPVELLAV
jgi:hypothetical protein